MTVHNVFIFVTKNFIQSGFIRDNKIAPISVDGNSRISNKDFSNLERLINSIKKTFNVEEIKNTDIVISVINCGAQVSVVDEIFELIKDSKKHSVIYAETIIPFICLIKDILKKESSTFVSILDSVYQISKEKKGTYKCELVESDSKTFELNINDFINLIEFDVTKIIRENNKVQKLQNEIKKQKNEIANCFNDNEKLEQELSEYKAEIKKKDKEIQDNIRRLRQVVLEKQARIDQCSFTNIEFNETLDLELTKSPSLLDIVKGIISVVSGKETVKLDNLDETEKSRILSLIEEFFSKKTNDFNFEYKGITNIEYKQLIPNNTIVLEGERLIKLDIKHKEGPNELLYIRAPRCGRLFLKNKLCNLFYEDSILGYICRIDVSDDKLEEFMED